MCYLMRTQSFFDGNKRTSVFFANSVMIKNGKGIISVSDENKEKFGELLTKFYESGDNTNLKNWLYETSIDGIEF